MSFELIRSPMALKLLNHWSKSKIMMVSYVWLQKHKIGQI